MQSTTLHQSINNYHIIQYKQINSIQFNRLSFLILSTIIFNYYFSYYFLNSFIYYIPKLQIYIQILNIQYNITKIHKSNIINNQICQLLNQIIILLKYYMQLNLKDFDQTHWVCYQFENNKYYYGQVAYLDENSQKFYNLDNIYPKDNLEMASNPTAKLVKHGVGIFVYSTNNQIIARYEGYWEKDKKNGNGKMVYENNSIYVGNWKDDMKNENGKFLWANGDTYQGFWKRDRLDGVGLFKHHEGFQLKGNFRCNYFMEGEILRNPFMNNNEFEKFKKARKDLVKLKQKINKQKVGYFQKINYTKHQQLIKLIDKSNSNNRIPLIFASSKINFSIQDFNQLKQNHKKNINNFDLRKMYVLPLQERINYHKQINKMLINTLKNGQLFIINLDDSNVKYEQLFYPDIREFYNSQSLPSQIWSKSDLSKKEIYSNLTKQPFEVSKNYNLCIWTKFRVLQDLDQKKIIEKIQKRFESILPIIKMDFIYLTS